MVAVAATLPVASTTATLTPVRKPGSSPIVGRAPAGAASSRSRKLAANTRTASCSAAFHSRSRRSTERWTRILVRQAQRTVSMSQRSPGRPAVCDGEAAHDAQLEGAAARLRSRSAFRLDGEIEDLLLLAAEQR